MIDVTERKEIEMALRAAEDKYRQIVEQVPAVIYVQDMTGNSRTSARSTSSSSATRPRSAWPTGTIWTDRIHPDDRDRVVAEDRRTYETGDPFNVEYRLPRRTAAMLWVQDSCVLVRDEQGEPQFWQGVMVDETALKRTEEELTESLDRLERINEERRLLLTRLVDAQERERTQIASDIHDDSVQVITAVGLRLHALRRQLTDPEHVALLDRLDQTVADAVARLRRLMFDLRPPALERDGLATAVESWLSQAAADAGFEYRVIDHLHGGAAGGRARDALPDLRGGPVQRPQARGGAATSSSPWRPRTAASSSRCRTTASASTSTASEQGSRSGHIGLSAIRERCRMSGGWCRIESEQGQGHDRALLDPAPGGRRMSESSSARRRRPCRRSTRTASRIRVLIADDEPAIREALADLLASEETLELVAVATDTDEAIEAARQTMPDVALLDVKMPGGGGPRAAREILSRHAAHAHRRALRARGPVERAGDAARRRGRLRRQGRRRRGDPRDRAPVGARPGEPVGPRHRLRRAGAGRTARAAGARVVRCAAGSWTGSRRSWTEPSLLRIVYQPIVDLASGRLAGVEALARFDVEPERPPDVWFAEAAAAGLTLELELTAIHAALADLSRIPQAAYLSLNMSPGDGGLAPVRRAAGASRARPHRGRGDRARAGRRLRRAERGAPRPAVAAASGWRSTTPARGSPACGTSSSWSRT